MLAKIKDYRTGIFESLEIVLLHHGTRGNAAFICRRAISVFGEMLSLYLQQYLRNDFESQNLVTVSNKFGTRFSPFFKRSLIEGLSSLALAEPSNTTHNFVVSLSSGLVKCLYPNEKSVWLCWIAIQCCDFVGKTKRRFCC